MVCYCDFNILGDINILWWLVEDVMFYGVYLYGFKLGGVNLNGLLFLVDGVIVVIVFV